MTSLPITHSIDLDADIDRYLRDGFRLDMLMPADSPREALLSKNGSVVRLQSNKTGGNYRVPEWITGRAGMEYRDLVPGRHGGKLIASHIRITNGGPVSDYVHYHKVSFQMIYCLRGRIRVVYEDQGLPFWLEPGDCVLQPPEIRHRVLEAEAGSEVVEISSPSEHETWVEHDLPLPSGLVRPDRDFCGQRFVNERANRASWKSLDGNVEKRDLKIRSATGRLHDGYVIRGEGAGKMMFDASLDRAIFIFVLNGKLEVDSKVITVSESITFHDDRAIPITFEKGFEALIADVDLRSP